MKLHFYDPKTKQKRAFSPLCPPEVRMYVCGPTVYNHAHLGHGRSAVVFDLLRRVLSACGYHVIFAKNFTDIDDKIIAKAKTEGKTIAEIAEFFISSYEADMAALNVQPPDLAPKATQNISKITDFVRGLLGSGAAYQNTAGDTYLSVAEDKKYGSLSGRGQNDDENIARIVHAEKRDEKDFALWKITQDAGFATDLGFGRPGWHIECSAMIDSVLAHDAKNSPEFCIDIHGGGTDLLFPHHENEASQTRLFCGRELARHWLHNEFVNIGGEKMSKSLGNSFFIKDALKIYDGEVLRNYLLGSHYRLKIDFHEQDLAASKKRLDKFYHLKSRLASHFTHEFEENFTKNPHQILKNSKFSQDFLAALCDDLNISLAFSVLEQFFTHANKILDGAHDASLEAEFALILRFFGEILGLGNLDPKEYFKNGADEDLTARVEAAIAERAAAKAAKNFARADEIRDELRALGVALHDTKDGVSWEKI